MTSEIGPDYRQLMDLIRSRVSSGEYPVGKPIPSTTDLRQETGMSFTSVRRAVRELQVEGVLEGHPGKAVFVRALPEDADRERADAGELGRQVAGLRQELRELETRVDSRDVLDKLGRMEARVDRIEAAIATFSKRSGQPNPLGAGHDGAEKAPRRGRAGR